MNSITHDLGLMPYPDALARQMEHLSRVQEAPQQAAILLVEHPPVITLGRRDSAGLIQASPERLAELGISLHKTTRGGLVTYHGPGQLVAYPIVHLPTLGIGVRRYVACLEEAIVATLASFGISAGRRDGLTGVWVGDAKIAAIGVAVQHGTAFHGLALNVAPDLSHFDLIVPCGLRGSSVTSMAKVLGRAVTVSQVKPVLAEQLRHALGLSFVGQASKPVQPHIGQPWKAVPRTRLPVWLKRPLSSGADAAKVRGMLSRLNLSTVCKSARCPNIGECFDRRTAAFMILGETCTRNCRFCAVGDGSGRARSSAPPVPDADEPARVAQAAAELGLRHVVITSVTRDDLPDGGAAQFAATIHAVRAALLEATVEVLTPDFAGQNELVDVVLAAGPDVFNHNIETVRRLHATIRPQADYDRSLAVLAHAATVAERTTPSRGSRPALHVKSGLMLGLGETDDEAIQTMRDLFSAGCRMLTVGQYLSPSRNHHPVARYVEPPQFARLENLGREMGFAAMFAGPFVRSNYLADRQFRPPAPAR